MTSTTTEQNDTQTEEALHTEEHARAVMDDASEALTEEESELYQEIAVEAEPGKLLGFEDVDDIDMALKNAEAGGVSDALSSFKETLRNNSRTAGAILGALYLAGTAGMAGATETDDAATTPSVETPDADVLQQLEVSEADVEVEALGMEDNDLSAVSEQTGELPVEDVAQQLDAGTTTLDDLLSNPDIPGQVKGAVLYETDAVDSNDSFEKPRLDVAKQLAQGDIRMAESIIDNNPEAFQDTPLDDWVENLADEHGLEVDMDDAADDEVDDATETDDTEQIQEQETKRYTGDTVEDEDGEAHLAIGEPVADRTLAENQAESQGVSPDNIDTIETDDGYVPAIDYEGTDMIEFEQEGDLIVMHFPQMAEPVEATVDSLDADDTFDLVRDVQGNAIGVYDGERDVMVAPENPDSLKGVTS